MSAVWMLGARLGAFPAAVLAYAAGALTTGAFHEDGLADTADALGGGTDRESVLRILKDSRIGTFGAVALILSFGLRITLLERTGLQAPIALLLSQCVSRTPAVWLMAGLPYVTPEPESRGRILSNATWPQAVIATAWPLALLVAAVAAGLLRPFEVAAILFVITIAGAFCAWRFVSRVGGVTGDFLGATQQVSEIAVLLTLVAVRISTPAG
jgi:adenosylcobinamide-GDP ribazoletransferase